MGAGAHRTDTAHVKQAMDGLLLLDYMLKTVRILIRTV